MKQPMEVAVIGVGRMGRHHARTYAKLDEAKLAAVVDPDADRAAQIADEHGGESYSSVQEMLTKHPNLQAATIAVPTVHHLPVAKALIEGGVAVLVEKPLAASPEEAHAIDDLARQHDVILQVGHTERFNPAVRRAVAMHVTPRYIEIDRVSPMTFRSLDIGVVMDLMIHDLDIVLALAQSPLAKIDAVGVVVMGKHEDVANARLVFENGCVASLTASRLALQTKRKMRLFSEDAYVSLDYQAREGVIIRRTDNNVVLDEVRHQIESGADLTELNYTDLITVEPLEMDDDSIEQDPLTAQARSFLSAVQTGSKVEVDGSAGCAAVEAAQQVVQAVAAHKWAGMEGIGDRG